MLCYYPNTGATNESGFSSIPAGLRGSGGVGSFYYVGNEGYWWSSTQYKTSDAWPRRTSYGSSNVYRTFSSKGFGFYSWLNQA